ncbi:MAG TPA: ATP-binding protein [Verrucomicrobiae bacterium]|jgi:signal transduction histidine kinase|nr:ATP-binding protein [Verrucomicrobiae bacterium]
MNLFHSIKWRLQIWHGLILVAVLASLGFTAYQLERNRQNRRLDDDLERLFPPLANAMHPPGDRPPPGEFPDEGPPPPRRAFHLNLPPNAAEWFAASDSNRYYYVIQSRDGHELARSTNAPAEGMFPPIPPTVSEGPNHRQPPPRMRTSGQVRELVHFLPPGDVIRVGCSTEWEARELTRTAWKLAGAGGVILLFGLAGGWWITARAIRPIHDISAAAVKISAGDFSQRIDMTEPESELGQITAVLNSTFARLESAFAEQRQFTSDAAHELRTPVSVMLTQTQTALQRERTAKEYRASLEACERAAQRMRRLITSLLELARLDAGQEHFRPAVCDLAEIVSDAVELVRPLAEPRRIKFHAKLAPSLVTVDAERFGRAVINLLTNAIQYNREDGEIWLTLETQNGLAILTVRDTGPGIAAEHLPHVFERFYRADPSRSDVTAHAGLGLAIAKSIVQANSGTIEAASSAGEGAAFTIRLPLCRD